MRNPLLLFVSLLFAAPSLATTLEYDAYVSGAKAGRAEVVIDVGDGRYFIRGKAWSTGLWNAFSRWRSRFQAAGAIDDGRMVPESFWSLVKKNGDKTREVLVSEGVLEETRNGERRLPREAPAPADLLSALFVPGGCRDFDGVYTGRSAYRVDLIDVVADDSVEGAVSRCAFEVIDEDDDDRYRAVIWYGWVDGLLVPLRADFDGAVKGSLRLG